MEFGEYTPLDPYIVNVTWMNEDFSENVNTYYDDDNLSLLVETRNYKEGDNISIVVRGENNEDIKDGLKEIKLNGVVDADGFSRIQFKTKD